METDVATRAAPLSRHVLFQSDDLDCARERVAQKFCNHRLDIIGDRRPFRAAHHHVRGDMISLNYISYGADVLIDPGELGHFYLIQVPLAGTATIRNGRKEFVSHGGAASVLNPHWATRMRWWQDCAQLLIQIRRTPFQAFAERLLDRELPDAVSFDPEIDMTRPEMIAWRGFVDALVHDAEQAPSPAADLSRAFREQQLLAFFIQAQPGNLAPFIDGRSQATAPRHVRRAEEFIRAHADAPIALLDIAEASGVNCRTLQLAYKSAYGFSPMHALQKERMRRVRYDLLQGDAATSVADIALKWGFSHLGRFSAAYRDEFGELPRQTLRNRNS